MYSSPADSQHRLSGPDSKGMEIHCMCLCCSHTVMHSPSVVIKEWVLLDDLQNHTIVVRHNYPVVCREKIWKITSKSMRHYSVVSDGTKNHGIVHPGCQHTQSVPSSSIWHGHIGMRLSIS